MPEVSVGKILRDRWQSLEKFPAGKWLFSKLLGVMVPYTGALGSQVQHLSPGHTIVTLKDRRKVRNHLHSVHAIALANLAEVSTGLAVLSGMPDDARGILAGIEIEYLKKARGLLTAECQCTIPQSSERTEYLIHGSIRDESGENVAKATARWLIGPIEIKS